MALTTKRRRAIIAAHGGICHYCGSPDAAQVDHIIPRADGGSDDLGNLIAACLPCNLRKLRHRLPADAEQTALAAAEAMRETVLALAAAKHRPRRRRGDGCPVGVMTKHNVLLPPAVWDGVQSYWQQQPMGTSLAAAFRDLIQRGAADWERGTA